MIKSATAIWNGSNKEGVGNVSTQSKILQNVFFTKVKDVSDEYGTNEFELLAASISVSFTNLLGEILLKNDFSYGLIEVRMELTVFREITQANLTVKIESASISNQQLNSMIEKVKAKCPILKILTIPVSIKFERK